MPSFVQGQGERQSQIQDEAESVKVYFEDGRYQTTKVNPKTATMEDLWELIGDSLGFSVESAQNFFIWGVEDDLEVLLYSESTVSQVRSDWPGYMKKWSNNLRPKTVMGTIKGGMKKRPSEIELQTITEFKFVFKRTSIVPISVERNIKNPTSTYLLYVQAAKNVQKSNYPSDVGIAISLAGLNLQVEHGDRNPEVYKPGFLRKEILDYIPKHLHKIKTPEEWEDLVYKCYETTRGKDRLISQMLYLQLVRQWAYYGCTFFKGFFVPNTEAFFQQHFSGDVVIGVNNRGIHLMDPVVFKVISVEFDEIDAPKSDERYFSFTRRKRGAQPEVFTFKTKQGDIINDLLHDWFAEFKRQKMIINKEKHRQSQIYLLEKSTSQEVHIPINQNTTENEISDATTKMRNAAISSPPPYNQQHSTLRSPQPPSYNQHRASTATHDSMETPHNDSYLINQVQVNNPRSTISSQISTKSGRSKSKSKKRRDSSSSSSSSDSDSSSEMPSLPASHNASPHGSFVNPRY